jgi:hypothetical protein
VPSGAEFGNLTTTEKGAAYFAQASVNLLYQPSQTGAEVKIHNTYTSTHFQNPANAHWGIETALAHKVNASTMAGHRLTQSLHIKFRKPHITFPFHSFW